MPYSKATVGSDKQGQEQEAMAQLLGGSSFQLPYKANKVDKKLNDDSPNCLPRSQQLPHSVIVSDSEIIMLLVTIFADIFFF